MNNVWSILKGVVVGIITRNAMTPQQVAAHAAKSLANGFLINKIIAGEVSAFASWLPIHPILQNGVKSGLMLCIRVKFPFP